MNQLNSLVNEYNNLFELSKIQPQPIDAFSSTNSGCINPLNEMYIGSHDSFLNDTPIYPITNGSAILQTSQYYNDKMTEIFDQINKLLIKKESFSTISGYIDSVAKLKDAESTHKFINNENDKSVTMLQNSSIMFMKWLFIFLFILSMSFQLFENMFLKSVSFVSFIASIIVLLNIFKIINSYIFSIILLLLFSVIVLMLFFKKMYIPSLTILIFGAIGCNFYMNYKG